MITGMKINILRIIINPVFSLVLCIFVCIFNFNDTLIIKIIQAFCILLSISSLILSIIKSIEFSTNLLGLSIFIIFIISILSFLFVSIGGLIVVFLFGLWIFCIIVSIVTIIQSISYKVNHIINYLLLFSILSAFIGLFYVNHKVDNYEKELLSIANKIEEHYEINEKTYDIDDIDKILENYKRHKIKLDEVTENYFIISINTAKDGGGTYSIFYDSRYKEVRKKRQY